MNKQFKPLTIVARLKSALSISDPIPLEGILYDARYRQHPELKGTPLDCLAYRTGIPLASASYLVADGISGAVHGTTEAVRGILVHDLDRLHVDASTPSKEYRIDAMSPYRNRIRTYPLIAGVTKVLWQAVGDAHGIRLLLAGVFGIGAMRSRGYGEVLSWEVIELDEAFDDHAWFHDGRPMRNLPVALVKSRLGAKADEFGVSMRSLDGPLHLAENEVPVIAPQLADTILSSAQARRIFDY